MNERLHPNCRMCHERVDPDDRDVVYAVEMKRVVTADGSMWVEGNGAFFHDFHFPAGRQWRRTEKPQPRAA